MTETSNYMMRMLMAKTDEEKAAGCELSVNALRNGKATWELDTATRKAAAEF